MTGHPISKEVPWGVGAPSGTGVKDQYTSHYITLILQLCTCVSSKGIRLPEVDLGGKIGIYCSVDGGFFFLVKKVQIE